MIERKVIDRKLKELQIKEYMADILDKPGYSHIEIHRTPLGEKITIYTSKPGLIVGSKGSIIKELTEILKRKFNLENPQIEVSEVDVPYLNPKFIAKHIVHTFEKFGPSRFKFIGHKLLDSIMASGAIGAEIVISGRGVPSKRSKTWRFSAGHLKKSGDVSLNLIRNACSVAHLKSGAIGVKVLILTPDIQLPDEITIKKIEAPIKEANEEKGKSELKDQEEKKEEKLSKPKDAKASAEKAKKPAKKAASQKSKEKTEPIKKEE